MQHGMGAPTVWRHRRQPAAAPKPPEQKYGATAVGTAVRAQTVQHCSDGLCSPALHTVTPAAAG
ncbi:hypothetical protein [Neisseria sp.]|uniref:hypothetical protein n=1 Tax=Neisseria sp. TaxID=192066 RepID=UPI00359FDC06